jgi:two-component system, cell cycle response regulator
MDQDIDARDGVALGSGTATLEPPKQNGDPIANTHVCNSPCVQDVVEKPRVPIASAYLIMVRGGIPGTMLRLDTDGLTLGRSADCEFQFHDGTVSRRHAVVRLDPGGDVQFSDQGSTNGSFVNGRRIPARRPLRLEDGDRIQLGTSVILKLVRLDPHDEEFQRELFERSVRDPLTGLYNRAFFLNQIRSLAARCAVRKTGLAVLMLDVDHFKAVNDRHGHDIGDKVLMAVAGVLRETTRAEDLVARYGGEEFVAALPVNEPDLAGERAERIRCTLAARRIAAASEPIRVTASLGLAYGLPGAARNELALIRMADQALYRAKASGRDRVVFGHDAATLACARTDSAEIAALV